MLLFDLERYIWNRASQQGQLWWKTYSITQGETHLTEFEDEIIAVLNGPLGREELIGANNGIYKIMYLCAPESVIDWKLGTGSRYTEAGMAAVYYYFGGLGVIVFASFMGLAVAAIVNCFLRFLANNNLIAAMFMLRIFMIERTFLSMFTMADFFKPLSLLSYIYFYFAWNRVPIIKFKDGIKLFLKRC